MNSSTPGFSVLRYLPEFAQTNVHWVSDAIQPSHSLLSSSLALNLSQHQGLSQSQLFTSVGQIIGASASVLPMNIQGWFPLGLIGLNSSLSKGLSRVFSSTTIQKHWFTGAQSSLWFSSHIYTWLLEAKWISNHNLWRKKFHHGKHTELGVKRSSLDSWFIHRVA